MKFRRRATSAFTLIELMIVVAIIGILAAVAIPAFMKYIRRSKTTEATMNVRKMFDSTVSYYEAEHAVAGALTVLPKQFPAPTGGWYPAQGSACGFAGKKFPAGQFKTAVNGTPAEASFNAINFGVDDPFYYSYDIEQGAGGTGAAVGDQTLLQASGDLTCDGIYSLFQRTAQVDANFGVAGSSGLYTVNEIE
jgi:type IV pilus assembly protein PilA